MRKFRFQGCHEPCPRSCTWKWSNQDWISLSSFWSGALLHTAMREEFRFLRLNKKYKWIIAMATFSVLWSLSWNKMMPIRQLSLGATQWFYHLTVSQFIRSSAPQQIYPRIRLRNSYWVPILFQALHVDTMMSIQNILKSLYCHSNM